MELSICCDAAVKLENMRNVNEVQCVVNDYKITGDALEGNIRIFGSYIKDDVENVYDFVELVPFTIVFKDKNFRVDNIEVRDFECQEIVNQGIECSFTIHVEYSPLAEEVPVEIVEQEEEVILDEEQVTEETLEEASEEEEIELLDDAIKNEINQKYNELLNEILEARAEENFYESEAKKAITIHSGESRDDCRGFLKNLKSDYKSIKVYYTSRESDIEQICKNEHVSVDKVFRDNKGLDFAGKRRIIIK